MPSVIGRSKTNERRRPGMAVLAWRGTCPTCIRRDLRHGLAARLLRVVASGVTGGPTAMLGPLLNYVRSSLLCQTRTITTVRCFIR
jgi:hypothetical protein